MALIVESRAQVAVSLVCGLILIAAVGLVLLKRIGKGSPLRKLHGKYVLAWMLIGWTLGAVYILIDEIRDDTHIAFALFGMLAGWLIGMIHGGLAVWWRTVRKNRAA